MGNQGRLGECLRSLFSILRSDSMVSAGLHRIPGSLRRSPQVILGVRLFCGDLGMPQDTV